MTRRVVVTGMGKPGFVAQKISATMASTGTSSYFVHPAEAAHGDLGRISRDDLVIALSNSGETEELLRLLPAIRTIGARLVAVTRDTANPLARGADLTIPIGNVEEACPMGLAPTASTAVLLAVGAALGDFTRGEKLHRRPQRIAHGKRLVDEKNVWIDVDRRGEGKADKHTAGVVLYRLVDELADVGEFDDGRHARLDIAAAHAGQRGAADGGDRTLRPPHGPGCH